MPGGDSRPPSGDANLFYSFDVGPAHFIGFITEFYFFVEYGWQQVFTTVLF